MPKVSQEHLESQRLHILMAAFKCFGRKGFHETTMREICKEAEMSPGAVYNYFDGKKAIIRAIAEKSRSTVHDLFDSVDQSKSAVHTLQEILKKMAEHIEYPETENGHVIRIRLWGEILKDEELKNIFKENINDLTIRLSELIEKAKKEKGIRSNINESDLAQFIIATYQGMVLQQALNVNTEVSSIFKLILELVRK